MREDRREEGRGKRKRLGPPSIQPDMSGNESQKGHMSVSPAMAVNELQRVSTHSAHIMAQSVAWEECTNP